MDGYGYPTPGNCPASLSYPTPMSCLHLVLTDTTNPSLTKVRKFTRPQQFSHFPSLRRRRVGEFSGEAPSGQVGMHENSPTDY